MSQPFLFCFSNILGAQFQHFSSRSGVLDLDYSLRVRGSQNMCSNPYTYRCSKSLLPSCYYYKM